MIQLVPERGHRLAEIAGTCSGDLVASDFVIQEVVQSCTIEPRFVPIQREDVADLFSPRSIREDGYTLRYHVYSPPIVEGELYPLILAVHGTTEGAFAARGEPPNPHLIDNPGEALGRPVATAWVQPHVRESYPSYVVAPLVPLPEGEGQWYDDVLFEIFGRVLDEVIASEPIDVDRIYVVGHSIGAGVAWSIPAVLPDRFAAILPMAGGWLEPGNGVRFADVVASEYPSLAIWNFGHLGDVDGSVSVTRAMRETMSRGGIELVVLDNLDSEEARRHALDAINGGRRYVATEYDFPCTTPAGDCHWASIDAASEEPLFFRWLFRQRQRSR